MNPHLIPDRRWTATVTLANGTAITTTIYGPNATAAELNYLKANPGILRVVVRAEQGIR